jgi:hypothetical protein
MATQQHLQQTTGVCDFVCVCVCVCVVWCGVCVCVCVLCDVQVGYLFFFDESRVQKQ